MPKIPGFLTSKPLWTVVGAGAALAGGVYYYASRVEARSYRLEHLPPVRIAGGGRNGGGADGSGRRLRILHLSDLHLCEPESHKLEFLNSLPFHEYDLAVFTGDIFENESGLQYARFLLGSARPRLGAFAVLGNHDYYAYTWFNKTVGRLNRKFRHPAQKRDVEPFVRALAEAGITTLRNESVFLSEANAHLVGIDYPGTTPENLQNMVASAPRGALNLAILHLPRRLQNLVDAGVHLAFAGHTHGGQIRVPGFGALITDSELPREEASGLVQRGDTLIHVSRGLSADPKTNFRLFCPPAATVVEVEY